MIEYISYKSVNGVPFGATEDEVIAVYGKPESKDINDSEKVLYYKNIAVNFNDKGEAVYFGITRKPEILINGVRTGWTLKEVENIIQMDSHPVVDGAYITLRDLGVLFINFHDIEDDDMSERVIAFFAKGEMEIYDSEQPFKLNEQLDNPYNRLKLINIFPENNS